jgi:hypothetical protein
MAVTRPELTTAADVREGVRIAASGLLMAGGALQATVVGIPAGR